MTFGDCVCDGDDTGGEAPACSTSIVELGTSFVDAVFLPSQGSVVVALESPAVLLIVEPNDLQIEVVPLERVPKSLSVSPDERRIAVGHDGLVTLFDVATRLPVASQVIQENVHDVVSGTDDLVYLFGASTPGKVYTVDMAAGTASATGSVHLTHHVNAFLHRSGERIYGIQDREFVGVSTYSPDPVRIDLGSDGSASVSDLSPALEDGGGCGPLWPFDDGTRLLTSCGVVFKTTDAQSSELGVAAKIGIDHVSAMAHLPGRSELVLGLPSPPSLRVVDHQNFFMLREFPTPCFDESDERLTPAALFPTGAGEIIALTVSQDPERSWGVARLTLE